MRVAKVPPAQRDAVKALMVAGAVSEETAVKITTLADNGVTANTVNRLRGRGWTGGGGNAVWLNDDGVFAAAALALAEEAAA